MEADKVTALMKALVRQCKLFQGLDETELTVLVANSQMQQYPRGKILYRKGEKSNDTFCLLISGSVNIVAKDGRIVKELGPGEVIGEIALSNPYQTRTVSVITKDPIEILEWNVNHIKGKIPDLWKKLLKLAWEHMRDYYEE